MSEKDERASRWAREQERPRRPERKVECVWVVDVESTCWMGPPPVGEVSEIIQVGLVRLDVKSLAFGDKRLCWVKPARSTVSGFCTRLTEITQADVDREGRPLEVVCEEIVKEVSAGGEAPWMSYGDYDRRMFERNCRDLKTRYPFGGRHGNVKTLIAAAMGWGVEVGLGVALERLGFSFEGRKHQADDDAWNVARVVAELFQRCRAGGRETIV